MPACRRFVATSMLALATVVTSEAAAQPQPPAGQPATPAQPPPSAQPLPPLPQPLPPPVQPSPAPPQPPPGAPSPPPGGPAAPYPYPYPVPYPAPFPPGAGAYPQPYGYPGYLTAPQPTPPRPQPPRELDYAPGDPIPEDYRLTTHENRALVATGAVMFGVPYLGGAAATGLVMLTIGTIDALGGGGSDVKPFLPLFLPVAGPFITLSTARNELEGSTRALLVADGILQTVGMGLLVAGIAWPDQVLVYRGHSTPTPEPAPPTTEPPGSLPAPPPAPTTAPLPPPPTALRVVPSVSTTGFGIALAGTL